MPKKLPPEPGKAKYPEQAGVSSAELAAFVRDIEDSAIELHSVIVISNGKIAFERYREPYGPDLPHIMYSVSKSITAIAVGFAVEEGLLSLESKVIDFFPSYRPKKLDERLESMTVRHLLTMTAGKDIPLSSDKAKVRWLEEFFTAPWCAAPGEEWRYISENQYILSAIVFRVTGMTMTDYLMPRLFEPLGITRRPFWEKSADGLEAGGWGIYLTTREMAKIMLCCLQGGKYGGRRVIPRGWAAEMVKKQEDNARHRDDEPDTNAGYGYCFWRNAVEDSYRADGMYSQFGIVFEKLGAVVCVTGCEMNERKTRECIWRHFPAAFIEPSATEPAAHTAVEQFKPLEELPASAHSVLEKKIGGRLIKIEAPKLLNTAGYAISMVPLPVLYMSHDRAGNIDKVIFTFEGDECTLSWSEGKYRNTVRCGMDGKARRSRVALAGFTFTASCTACWVDENTLAVWFRPLEAICQRRLRFVFCGGKVRMIPETFPSAESMMDYVSERVKIYINSPAVVKAGEAAAKGAAKIVEPVHRGVLV